jgi:WD40-like Beta Propeller Repeat
VNVTAGRTVYRSAERPEASGWGVATLLREIIAMDVKTRGGEGKDLTIRTLYWPALIVAGVLLACVVALLAHSEKKAQAAFPGKNGRIAYSGFDGHDWEIYTINPRGGDKFQVTNNDKDDYSPDYSSNGKKIVYTSHDLHDDEIYTINVGGGGKSKITDNRRDDYAPDWSPDGKRIAFYRFDGRDMEIYTIKADGRGE